MEQIMDIACKLFKSICGPGYVFADAETLASYQRDQTTGHSFPFELLIKPGNAEEISEILRICSRHGIPVTPRGGGSGVTGGALPVQGGVVLSLERLNKIISIDAVNAHVVAESGVVTNDLCEAVRAEGLYFPVVTGSSAYSFIGGNVSSNAGSMYSCKYGNTAKYVLNLEAVLPSGDIIWTGANIHKNATGLNLTQLLVGSEGTLAVITKVVYHLLPPPGQELLVLAGFNHVETACEALLHIKRSGLCPSIAELIDGNALYRTAAYLNNRQPLVEEGVQAHLLIGLQEPASLLGDTLIQLTSILEKYTSKEILVAESYQEKKRLTCLRSSIHEAMVAGSAGYRDIDVSVPLSSLYEFLCKVQEIGHKYDVELVCFGHALDGNLHTMLLNDPAVPEANWQAAVIDIYQYAISKGGVISGEHGIGLLQKNYMNLQCSPSQLALMRSIKKVFDPRGILNPGKII